MHDWNSLFDTQRSTLTTKEPNPDLVITLVQYQVVHSMTFQFRIECWMINCRSVNEPFHKSSFLDLLPVERVNKLCPNLGSIPGAGKMEFLVESTRIANIWDGTVTELKTTTLPGATGSDPALLEEGIDSARNSQSGVLVPEVRSVCIN